MTSIRLILGVLVIFFINSGGNAQITILFSELPTLIEWCNKLWAYGSDFKAVMNSFEKIARDPFKEIQDEIKHISNQLDGMSTKINLKLDHILKTLIADLPNSENLQKYKSDLNKFLNRVEVLYNRAIKLEVRKHSDDVPIKKFINAVLYDSNNLPETLELLHQLLFPTTKYIIAGFLPLMIKTAQNNIQYDCDKYTSAQQRMYYIYIQIILAEMKGLTIMTYVHSIQQVSEKSLNYTIDLEEAKNSYRTRVRNYHEESKTVMNLLPREVHRCNSNQSKRGVDFIELYRFSRAMRLNEMVLTQDHRHHWTAAGHCESTCPELKNSRLGYDIQKKFTIYDCQYLGGQVTVCPAPSHSNRDDMWWKTKSATFGHNITCDDEVDASGFREANQYLGVPIIRHNCDECVCSVDLISFDNDSTNSNAVASISILPQISDISKNMVVTGVKFVLYDHAIHLEIQETKFLSEGTADNSSSWKKIGQKQFITYNGRYDKKLEYAAFNHTWKTLHIDDVMLPNNYAVTGVKFARDEEFSSFALNVHGTPFSFHTGLLDPHGSRWFKPKQYTFNSSSYKRLRIEIDLKNPDDPTLWADYDYDQDSNKFIKITHTDIHKDAGQNTVPFFDAQAVETRPPFPLSGIGLHHRGKDGFGGYISPRIFTFDISKIRESEPLNTCRKIT